MNEAAFRGAHAAGVLFSAAGRKFLVDTRIARCVIYAEAMFADLQRPFGAPPNGARGPRALPRTSKHTLPQVSVLPS